MSKQNKLMPVIIALVAVVGIAGAVLIGWSAGSNRQASQPSPIDGKWRPNYAANCSENTYLEINEHEMHLIKAGVEIPTVKFAINVSGSATQPMIRITFPDSPSKVSMELSARVSGDAMTFSAADWSPEAIREYGRDFLEARSPAQNTLSTFQSIQPLHRCP